MQINSDKSSLVVVGCGIKFCAHLTTEAIAYIQQSDIVLYLVNDPVLKSWIQKQNQNTESLDLLYGSCSFRAEAYQSITNYVLEHLYQKKTCMLCSVWSSKCFFQTRIRSS
ncbi:MAG: hypothetical protein QM652_03090 [Legionella sp.]|uniref:hypothetical protein n=1 Tax=Legionella sp. TaxID=459 RepID=UPI0039E58C18